MIHVFLAMLTRYGQGGLNSTAKTPCVNLWVKYGFKNTNLKLVKPKTSLEAQVVLHALPFRQMVEHLLL